MPPSTLDSLPRSNLTVDRRRPLEEHVEPSASLIEDAPANSVGAGKIAGANGDPPVRVKNKYKAAGLKQSTLLRRSLPK
jgi:hypothetical protein